VFINNNRVHLFHKEYQLLLVLEKHPNRVWTAEQLYDDIWGYNSEGTPQTVKVHISNVRVKLYKHSKIQSIFKPLEVLDIVFLRQIKLGLTLNKL